MRTSRVCEAWRAPAQGGVREGSLEEMSASVTKTCLFSSRDTCKVASGSDLTHTDAHVASMEYEGGRSQQGHTVGTLNTRRRARAWTIGVLKRQ